MLGSSLRGRHLALLFLSCLVVAPLYLGAASAQTISVRGAWIPEAPPVAAVLAGYMTIVNAGSETRRITAVSSPDFSTVEIHQTVTEGGMSRMKKLEALVLYAGDEVQLRPGGMHLMLIKPTRTLRDGDEVDLTLRFDNGETLKLKVPVKAGDQAMPHHHHHHRE